MIFTPDLSASILPGITRDSVVTIARDLGYEVVMKPLISTDLYVADELFMTGTAAEVTPIRSVDDQEIGDPGPVTRAIQDGIPGDRHGARAEVLELARARPGVGGHGLLTTRTVPLSKPFVGEREEELVLEVLRSGRLALGPMIERFERALAERVGSAVRRRRLERHGRAPPVRPAGRHRARGRGDHLAVLLRRLGELRALRGRDSGVRGCRSADAEPRPGCGRRGRSHRQRRQSSLSTSSATRASSSRCARSPPRTGLPLIEDACEALGAEYRGRPLGSFEHPAVFAFYPNKQVTTGEGGAVAVHTEDEWRLLKSLANQGRADSGGWLEHARFGYNYRLDDLSAAVGLAQLEKLDEILERRAAVAARYAGLLADVDGVDVLLGDDAEHRRSWFVYPVRLAAGIDRESLIAELAAAGIATSRYLPSIHLQPYMRERFGFAEGMCPVSEEASRSLLALPFYTELDGATRSTSSTACARRSSHSLQCFSGVDPRRMASMVVGEVWKSSRATCSLPANSSMPARRSVSLRKAEG